MHQAHGVLAQMLSAFEEYTVFLLGRGIKYFFKEARNNLIPKSVSGVLFKDFYS